MSMFVPKNANDSQYNVVKECVLCILCEFINPQKASKHLLSLPFFKHIMIVYARTPTAPEEKQILDDQPTL